MKLYFQIIRTLQNIFLGIGILILLILPSYIVFTPTGLSATASTNLFLIVHTTLLFVMSIRPLADIFSGTKWIRPLVQLRKGTGVLAASIVVAFMLAKIMLDPFSFFASLGTSAYWSLNNLALLAHLADLSGVLLLITSNNYSKHVLGRNWKRLQRLSYVFFFASAIYVYSNFDNTIVLNYMFIVAILTTLAFIKNRLNSN